MITKVFYHEFTIKHGALSPFRRHTSLAFDLDNCFKPKPDLEFRKSHPNHQLATRLDHSYTHARARRRRGRRRRISGRRLAATAAAEASSGAVVAKAAAILLLLLLLHGRGRHCSNNADDDDDAATSLSNRPSFAGTRPLTHHHQKQLARKRGLLPFPDDLASGPHFNYSNGVFWSSWSGCVHAMTT